MEFLHQNCIPLEFRESKCRGGRKNIRARGDGEYQNKTFKIKTNKGHTNSWKGSNIENTWVCTRSISLILCVPVWCFYRIPEFKWVGLWILCLLLILLHLLVCLFRHQYDTFCLYLIILYFLYLRMNKNNLCYYMYMKGDGERPQAN